MNTQVVRHINDAVGIAVFLLLAVAVVAGQAHANIPREEVLDSTWILQSGTRGAPIDEGVRQQLENLSETIDRIDALLGKMDSFLQLPQPTTQVYRANSIPE